MNVFKGDSHSGKSSIMRLLEWVLFNSLRGGGFRSHFAKKNEDTEGTIVFSEGTYVTRRKGKKNSYLSEGLSLDAVRSDVPDEIKEITKISRINFQGQGDRYYLLEDSPGVVGKKLNEIVGLEIIDTTKTKINKIINETSLRLKITREDIEETEQELIKYDNLGAVETIINKITKSLRKLDEKRLRYEKIESIVEKIEPIRKRLIELKKWMRVEEEYNALMVKIRHLKELEKKHSKIEFIIESLKEHNSELQEMKKWIIVEGAYNKLVKKYKLCNEKRFKHSKIFDICSDIHKAEKSANSLRDLLKTRKERESELQKSLNYCQVCGSNKKYWRK